MAAVMHAALVAREQERGECLRPDREAKHLVAEDALGDELADGREHAVGAFGLPVVLDRARGEAGGGLAVDETRARERGVHRGNLVGREHMADNDLHPGSSARRHDRRVPSNLQSRPPDNGRLRRLLEPFKTMTLLDGFGSKLYVSAAAPNWPC